MCRGGKNTAGREEENRLCVGEEKVLPGREEGNRLSVGEEKVLPGRE